MSVGDSDSDHSEMPLEDSDSEISGSLNSDCENDSVDIEASSGAESDSDSSPTDETDDKAEEHFFEGVEKLLEVWFTRSDGKTRDCNLRKIPEEKITALLDIVNCTIINRMSNDQLDAYVLSESSLFVSSRRFILKTCGKTTPLLCVKKLISFAKEYAGFDQVEDAFYSRKNYKRPDLQRSTHREFDTEVRLLEEVFQDGSAYCMGSANSDHWYLYTLRPYLNGKPRQGGFLNDEPDQTLEIIMTNLDPDVMRIFSKSVCANGKEATQKSGIDRIIPNAIINDHLFDPCGYSMNGIFPNSETQDPNGSYMTIHITPEEEFSYVSFETNAPHCSYKEVINRVLEVFQPGQFLVTVFANKASKAYQSHADIDRMVVIKEWLRSESQFDRFVNYDLTYARYTKYPS